MIVFKALFIKVSEFEMLFLSYPRKPYNTTNLFLGPYSVNMNLGENVCKYCTCCMHSKVEQNI